MRLIIVLAVVVLAGCTGMQPKPVVEDPRIANLNGALEAGQIGYLDHAKEMAKVTMDLYPDNYHLHALAHYRVMLASQYEKGEITKEVFNLRWAERMAAFQDQMRPAPRSQSPGVGLPELFLLQQLQRPRSSNCYTTGIGSGTRTECF